MLSFQQQRSSKQNLLHCDVNFCLFLYFRAQRTAEVSVPALSQVLTHTMMLRPGQLVSWLGTLFLICGEVRGLGDAVVYAVNCGGEAHTDMLGVKYERDDNKHGTPSEYGKQLLIGRVSQQDQVLYQTERYHTATFGYDMPVQGDGDYLLILKFSEVRLSITVCYVNISNECCFRSTSMPQT